MIKIEGELKLYQENEIIKHINLELIMKYINKLYMTRRVNRDWKKISEEHKEKIGFDPRKYGFFGKYYYKDDMKETIPDINDYGNNPSMLMPYYIEKNDKNEYFLKSQKNPKGNNLDSSSKWLYFLHKNIFWHLGIETEGKIKITDNKDKAIVKINKNNIEFKSNNMDTYYEVLNKNELLDLLKEYPKEKTVYYPYFLEEISKQIETKKLNQDYGFEP